MGFRLRGNTSRSSAKKSFKVDFNHFVPGRDFFGIEKDMYTVIHPSSELICDALRIEIKPMKDKFVGILDLDLRIKN